MIFQDSGTQNGPSRNFFTALPSEAVFSVNAPQVSILVQYASVFPPVQSASSAHEKTQIAAEQNTIAFQGNSSFCFSIQPRVLNGFGTRLILQEGTVPHNLITWREKNFFSELLERAFGHSAILCVDSAHMHMEVTPWRKKRGLLFRNF